MLLAKTVLIGIHVVAEAVVGSSFIGMGVLNMHAMPAKCMRIIHIDRSHPLRIASSSSRRPGLLQRIQAWLRQTLAHAAVVTPKANGRPAHKGRVMVLAPVLSKPCIAVGSSGDNTALALSRCEATLAALGLIMGMSIGALATA